jgi:hypothetical protein
MILARGSLNGKLLGYFEYQPRLKYDTSSTQATMHRNAFGWQAYDKHSFWVGHAYLVTRIPSEFSEFRTFLQWFHQSRLTFFKASQQVRVEQRKFSTNPHLSHRLRYKFRILQPIFSKQKTYYVFQNEIFYNVNTISSNNRGGFEQNRLYLGISQDFGSGHNGEIAVTRTLRFIKNDTNALMNFFVLRYAYLF